MKTEDVKPETQNVTKIDVSSVSRPTVMTTIPIIDIESDHWIRNSVTQPITNWGLSAGECERIMDSLEWLAMLDQEPISSLESPTITIIYDTLFGDMEIRVSDGDASVFAIVYRVQTTEVGIVNTEPDDEGWLRVSIHQNYEYRVGEFSLFMTSEREAILGDFRKMVADDEKATTMTAEEIKRVILEELQNELGRNVKVELSPKGEFGAVRIAINGKIAEFKAGDKMTNLLVDMIRATRNFKIYMQIEDLYLKTFGHDDFYLTREQKADKELAHRRHVNMRKLSDLIRNINLKVRRETDTKHDLITKVGDKLRLNPELQRLKNEIKIEK